MKKNIAILLLCLIAPAHALELAGAKLEDKVHLESGDLILNGAGLRTKLFFKVYVAGLYLGEKKHAAAAVLADAGAKRVALHPLREMSSEQLLEAFNKAIAANHAPAEMTALDTQLSTFSAIFRTTGEVAKGDVITLDYLPALGTRISINGVEKGRVAGQKFNRALLKIWLGDHPVDEDLKKGMLGG